MRYLWAAYQMDFWRDSVPSGLTREAFAEMVMETLGAFDIEWILEARLPSGPRPVGLVVGKFLNNGERVIEPHLEWFPWVTTRQKLETTAQFVREIGKKYKILVFARDTKLWDRLQRYRILKKASKIKAYFSSDEDAQLYYTAGPD